jgi:hypothetical protein
VRAGAAGPGGQGVRDGVSFVVAAMRGDSVDALSTSQVSNATSSSKNTASVWTIDMAAA